VWLISLCNLEESNFIWLKIVVDEHHEIRIEFSTLVFAVPEVWLFKDVEFLSFDEDSSRFGPDQGFVVTRWQHDPQVIGRIATLRVMGDHVEVLGSLRVALGTGSNCVVGEAPFEIFSGFDTG